MHSKEIPNIRDVKLHYVRVSFFFCMLRESKIYSQPICTLKGSASC